MDNSLKSVSAPEFEYILERSPKRRKTISILIRAQSVIVRAPVSAAAERIDELLKTKRDWIIKKLAESKARAETNSRNYISGELFKFLGNEYPLALEKTLTKRVKPAVFTGGCLKVEVPTNPGESDRSLWVRESLRRWYRPRAQNLMTKTMRKWSATTGLEPDRILVKELKSSWGICTRQNISLNWRLIMLPAPLIEYVVVHELCHLRHKNHSAVFYELVESFLPDYKIRRKALRGFAASLDL